MVNITLQNKKVLLDPTPSRSKRNRSRLRASFGSGAETKRVQTAATVLVHKAECGPLPPSNDDLVRLTHK